MTTEGDTPGAARQEDLRSLADALNRLRDVMQNTRYALPLPAAEQAAATAATLTTQLDDYLLPRLRRIDAPLLTVVGGSTGAGKSTLVNSLVRVPVSPAGVLRPTTRAPVLVCDPDDTTWFTEPHLLPGLTRHTVASNDPNTLQIVSAPALARGLALLDAPDIDSVVDANRTLAAQLLAAADLWLFATTASRYADSVPWELLRDARQRGTAVAVVLNRVPSGAETEIAPHLAEMLVAQGLPGVPLFVLPESRLDGQRMLPEAVTTPLRGWLARLASSPQTRGAVVQRTVGGAVDTVESSVTALATAADEQVTAAWALTSAVRAEYRAAESTVERGIVDGSLLRGEVLARWQELVDAGEVMRALQSRAELVRERLCAALAKRTDPTERFAEAVEMAAAALLESATIDAAEQAAAAWRANPAGTALLARPGTDLAKPAPELPDRVQRLVQDWHRAVLDLADAGAARPASAARATGRSGTQTATGLLVTALVFVAASAGPSGETAELATETTLASRKVLDAALGDPDLRAMAKRSREDLLTRFRALLAQESSRYQDVLDAAEVDETAADQLRAAANEVMIARLRTGLPAARMAPIPLPEPSGGHSPSATDRTGADEVGP